MSILIVSPQIRINVARTIVYLYLVELKHLNLSVWKLIDNFSQRIKLSILVNRDKLYHFLCDCKK